MTKRIVIAAALLAAPLFAHAEQPPNLYIGATLGDYQIDQRDVGAGTDNTTDFGLRLGYHFGDFIGVEARAGLATRGFSGDSDPRTEYAGLYARFDLPFENANVYLLLGGSELRLDGDAVDDDEYDAASGGIGIELYGSESTAVSLEYMSYNDNAYSGLSIGLKHHFNMPSFRD